MQGWGWALVFLVPGIIAAIFGFAGIAGTATWIAQILFFLFVIAFILTFFWGRRDRA